VLPLPLLQVEDRQGKISATRKQRLQEIGFVFDAKLAQSIREQAKEGQIGLEVAQVETDKEDEADRDRVHDCQEDVDEQESEDAIAVEEEDHLLPWEIKFKENMEALKEYIRIHGKGFLPSTSMKVTCDLVSFHCVTSFICHQTLPQAMHVPLRRKTRSGGG